MAADGEDALPPGDRVGADYRMDGLQLGAHVLGRTSRLVVQLEARPLSHLLEGWLREGRG